MGAQSSVVENLDAALRSGTSSERAAKGQEYLKSDLEFYGLTVPQIRKIAKSYRREHPDLTRDELLELTTDLWSVPVYERRFLAVELLDLWQALLQPEDITPIEQLLRECRTWALLDGLSSRTASAVLARHPDSDAIVQRWAVDEDFWIRRSALLVHLLPLRSGDGDFDRFGRIADPMLEEKEFFIRKAIGWVLRDMSRRRPDEVYVWFAPRAHRASGVTVREAVKYLTAEQADIIMGAYKSREPVT